jgi:hypothetical protein
LHIAPFDTQRLSEKALQRFVRFALDRLCKQVNAQMLIMPVADVIAF